MSEPAPSLASKRCIPCRPGMLPLDAAAVAGLLPQLDGWAVERDGTFQLHHLAKRFKFKNFADGLAFANRVGVLADAEEHHPDVLIRWGEVTITVYTHAIDGLTESDFVLSAKIDAIPRS